MSATEAPAEQDGVCLPTLTRCLPVFRLDQGTSGVVCFARNEGALKDLHAQFRDKSMVEKRYTALVYGEVAEEEGSIDLPLRKDLDNPPKQVRSPPPPLSLSLLPGRIVSCHLCPDMGLCVS